nr:inner-membrane translocator [Lachnospiraceae bacterium]
MSEEKKFKILKLMQTIIGLLPMIALVVLFFVFIGVVQSAGYRLDMYLQIVFNEGVVLAVVATGAVFIYTLGTCGISLGAATVVAATIGVTVYNRTENFLLMMVAIFATGVL